MKIGLVRHGYSPTGGAERYLLRFANALEKAGHQSILFGSSRWRESDTWNREFCAVDAHSPLQFANRLEANRPKDRCDFLFSLERVFNCDAYRAGDGVHKAWLKRRAKAELPSKWKAFIRQFRSKHRQILKLESALYSPAPRTIITNSNFVKTEIIQYYGQLPARRIEVIYNGITLNEAVHNTSNKHEQRRALGLAPTDFVILFVGTGWERKGLAYAIEAFGHFYQQQNKNPHFLIIGRGNAKPFQRQFGNQPWWNRIHFLGPVLNPDHYYQAADLFVLPTLYDPFSNACLEAYRAGLPVITTRANGFSEILEPGKDGEVIENGDQTELLGAAMLKWLNKDRRAQSQKVIQEKLPRFAMDRHIELTLKALL